SFCGYRNTRFNLDSHIVAVGQKNFLHLLPAYRTPILPQSRKGENVSAVVNVYHVSIFRIDSCHYRFDPANGFVFEVGLVNKSNLSKLNSELQGGRVRQRSRTLLSGRVPSNRRRKTRDTRRN